MMTQVKKNMKHQGLSFIELLIAMVILGMTLAGFINVFASAKRLIALSQGRMSGGEIGRLVLDPLQTQVREDRWGTATAVHCLSTNSCAPVAVAIQNRNYNAVYTIDNEQPIANVNRVTVDINWNEIPI